MRTDFRMMYAFCAWGSQEVSMISTLGCGHSPPLLKPKLGGCLDWQAMVVVDDS